VSYFGWFRLKLSINLPRVPILARVHDASLFIEILILLFAKLYYKSKFSHVAAEQIFLDEIAMNSYQPVPPEDWKKKSKILLFKYFLV